MSLAARSLRIAGALLGSAFVASAAHALDPDRAISQFPHAWYEEQLPQNTVLSITQRGDGSIWLATYAGLVSGADGAVLQRPSLAGDGVLIATRERLIEVGFDGGAPTVLVDGRRGVPAAPR